MPCDLSLVPFSSEHLDLVLGWFARSPYSAGWTPPDGTDPDLSGHLLLRAGVPVAYGELWVEPDEDEAELAHLVVDPAHRRQGLGRALTLALAELARSRGLAHVTLRVEPDNAVAIALYGSIGFVRESPEDEARFNAPQPRAYQWMRLPEA